MKLLLDYGTDGLEVVPTHLRHLVARAVLLLDPGRAVLAVPVLGDHEGAFFGWSRFHFQRHVQPFVPCVYSGQLRLYQPRDLERWVVDETCSGGKAD